MSIKSVLIIPDGLDRMQLMGGVSWKPASQVTPNRTRNALNLRIEGVSHIALYFRRSQRLLFSMHRNAEYLRTELRKPFLAMSQDEIIFRTSIKLD